MDIWNRVEGAKLSNTIVLHDQDGQIVFSTISNHDKEWHSRERKIGLYRSTCQIPANLLSPGVYAVTVIICANDYTDYFQADNVVRFEVIDSGEVRGDYSGGYAGVVRPLLEWKTIFLQLENFAAELNIGKEKL
jgi:lipopolysaccharide transport system ATP-binding protein